MGSREKKRSCCLPNSVGCCLGVVLLFVCILGIPAAGLYYLASGGPEPLYSEDYEPQEADAKAYEDAYALAIRNAASNNRINLFFTQEQFAAWLNLRFRDQVAQQLGFEGIEENLTFQTEFEDGEATFFFQINVVGDFNINGLAVMTLAPAAPDSPADQPLIVEVKEFRFGPLNDAQSSFSEDVSEMINAAINEQLKDLEGRYRIDTITVDDGLIRFSGTVTSTSTQ